MLLQTRYLNGCLADYIPAPAWLIDPLADSVSFDAGAKVHDVADALCAWRATGVGPGATIISTAATGAIGSVFMKMPPLLAVGRVIAVTRSAQRLEQIHALSPDLVVTVATEGLGDDWESTQALTGRLREIVSAGADALIDFTPDGPMTWQAVAALERTGSAVLMGPNQNPHAVPGRCDYGQRLAANERQTLHPRRRSSSPALAGSRSTAGRRPDHHHRCSLADIADAERLVRERYEPAWLVVINP